MPERMTTEQAVLLARAMKAGWPHQKFDDLTVDLWSQALRNADPILGYRDCMAAIDVLVMERTFGGPEAIREAVRAIRGRRLADARIDTITPNTDPDDVVAYAAEIRAITAAAADGVLDIDAYVKGGITLSGYPPRPALTAAEVSKPRAIEAAARNMFQPMLALTRADYEPVAPEVPKTVDAGRAAAQEAERQRQLAALVATFGPSVADGAPIPAGPEG